jgi:hypothetical protein
MHMHAAARMLQVGLGHEAGAVAVLERHAAGAATEQRGPVGGAQAVVEMAEIDFELAGAEFGGDHRGVDALVLGGLAMSSSTSRNATGARCACSAGRRRRRSTGRGELRQAVASFLSNR